MEPFGVKSLFIYSVVCVFILLVSDITRSYLLFRKSKSLVEVSAPFEYVNDKSAQKILVLGDSTAVGTGVTHASLSTAGRLSTSYPEADVRNFAQNGMRLEGLSSLVNDIKADARFSLVLVQIGANDIIRLTSLKDIESYTENILARLSKHSNNVIILHSGNIGRAPFFPLFVRPLLSRRSLQVREIYKKVSSTYGVEYVDLIQSKTEALLNENPSKYYAEDYLHLSDEGHGLWFSEIQKSLVGKTM